MGRSEETREEDGRVEERRRGGRGAPQDHFSPGEAATV